MRCNDFDAHIDEMLSGILHPDANQHMRQCERCASHLRARATVQNSLRKLASASANGPSRATDRAVMDSYRRLQQRRIGFFVGGHDDQWLHHGAGIGQGLAFIESESGRPCLQRMDMEGVADFSADDQRRLKRRAAVLAE